MPSEPKIAMRHGLRTKIVAWIAIVVIIIAGVGTIVWWKFFVERPQSFQSDLDRFKYGSLGSDELVGIPYPIFMILPRIFPDLVEKYATAGYGPAKAGYGGYGAFGLSWEEGQRLPIGLSIKRVGYDRVTVNCGLCHTTRYRLSEEDDPHFAYGGPSHTLNLQGLLRFLFAAADDERFNAIRLLPEIKLHFPLSVLDDVIYGSVLIPATRAGLRVAEHELGWMNSKPAWGPGRDDAFNLPKFILTQEPWDDTVGNTDFPALWGVGERQGQLLHSAGEAKSLYSVIATTAIGLGSLPSHGFESRNQWIEEFIGKLEPPSFPRAVDETLRNRGAEIFSNRCANCHEKSGNRVGTAIPLAELGTDPEHVFGWQQKDADRMNAVVRTLGGKNAGLEGAQGGYVARQLVGLWLLGPYLHNGSVPTLWDLLLPPGQRPTMFYRGYDVVDLEKVGFKSTDASAAAYGSPFDTRMRGNGNAGHNYGTDLIEAERRALLEYLKTL